MSGVIEYYIFNLGIEDEALNLLVTNGIIFIIIALVALMAYLLAKKLLNYYSHKVADKTATDIDDLLISKGVFKMLARIAPALTVYFMVPLLDIKTSMIESMIICLIIIFVVIALFRVLDAFVDSVKGRSRTKAGPMKGIAQVVKIAIGAVSALMIIATFMGNEKGWAVFSSIGGLSAVLLLIFKDSILGFVAGVQLSADGLLKLGDWLEMPKYNADGEVVDISLTKITVRNWDKTYTAIPAYKFLEESFKNWEGMSKSGGRRIKRSVSIDMNTIAFLNDDQLARLSEIDILKEYLSEKKTAIAKHNEEVMGQHLANKRQLTNIGTFRAYAEAYLRHHGGIHQGMTLMARQLPPEEKGVAIELYCFTNTTVWTEYEGIQADIFDHLLAIMPSFNLRPYQRVSGMDMVNIK